MPRERTSYSVCSVVHFKENSGRIIKQLRATGKTMVLTIDGRAEIVVQNAGAYCDMLERADNAEAIIGIHDGLASVRQGEGVVLKTVAKELRRKHKIPKQS